MTLNMVPLPFIHTNIINTSVCPFTPTEERCDVIFNTEIVGGPDNDIGYFYFEKISQL